MKHIILPVALGLAISAQAADISLTVDPYAGTDTISRMVYGQFAEHLGACVYEGIWVGEDSPIPNTKGYRNDALEALRELKVPVLRWRRLLCRRLPLARRHRRSGKTPNID